MDKEMGNQNDKFELPDKLEFENGADASCFWFAGAVLIAVLAAALIVYRTGNSELRTASNDAMPAAMQADPIAPPPILR